MGGGRDFFSRRNYAGKKRWLGVLDKARELIAVLPPEEVGCLYLRGDRTPVTPDPAAKTFAKLTRHRGCIRGAWPSVTPV